MYIRNINNIDYIKVNDTATQIQLKIFDNLNNPIDLKSAMQVVVVIGNHNGRILTKIPDLLDDTGVLEFGLDNGDLIEVGHNLLEVHIIMPNGEKFVAPSKGYYKLSATRSIDSLGEEVTTVTLDYFLEEANRALDQVNTKVESVNQTAEDLRSEVATAIQYVDDTVVDLQQEVSENLNQTTNDLRQEVATAIQYVDDTVDDLRQEVGENLDSLVTQEVDNKMTPFVEVVDERLTQKATEISYTRNNMNREILPKAKVRKPMMTFIDDDGRKEVLTKWEPILQEKKIKLTVAVVTSWVENKASTVMQWEDIHRLKNTYGVEFVSHTHEHLHANELTEEQIHAEFKQAKEILMREGLTHDIIVQPFGENNETVRRISRDYARANVATREGVNYPPLETFRLHRITLGEETNNTFAHYKSVIDEAIANNGWIIWKSHSQYPSFDETQIQHIKDIIDYARANGVDIVGVHEGLDRIGNIIDIGDYPSRASLAEYTVMDCDGIIHSKSNSKDFHARRYNSATHLTLLSDFPERSVTMDTIIGSNTTGFPENRAGTLITYRTANAANSFQEYHIAISNIIYKRRWNATNNNWNDWEKITSIPIVEVSQVNEYSNSSVTSDFPSGKVIYTQISSGHPDISSFPDGVAGTLITNTLFALSGYGYAYQEYHAYNGKVFRRRLHGNPVWEEIATKTAIGSIVSPLNTYNASTPITSFPDQKITSCAVNSQNAEGLPDNSAGILTTYRTGGNGYARQEFRKYRSNELWSRFVETDGTWTEWEKISAI